MNQCISRIFLFVLLSAVFFQGCTSDEKTGERPEGNYPDKFLFIGSSDGRRQAVYEYDLKNRSTRVFWHKRGEQVIDFSYSGGLSSAFFITAEKIGREGIFPYIRRARLYMIDTDENTVTKLTSLGDLIQLKAVWNPETEAYEVTFNMHDRSRSTVIVQKNYGFDADGASVAAGTHKYDITRQPFPQLLQQKKNVFFGPEEQRLAVVENGPKYDFYLKVRDREKFLASTLQPLNEVLWSSDGRHLIFSTRALSGSSLRNGAASSLFVYSLEKQKMQKTFGGGGYKNFSLQGDLLYFDDGFRTRSLIRAFDLRRDSVTHIIKLKGGCGVNNYPFLPDEFK